MPRVLLIFVFLAARRAGDVPRAVGQRVHGARGGGRRGSVRGGEDGLRDNRAGRGHSDAGTVGEARCTAVRYDGMMQYDGRTGMQQGVSSVVTSARPHRRPG